MSMMVMVMPVCMPCSVDMSYWWYGGKFCDTLMMMLISCSCVIVGIMLFYHGSSYLRSSLTWLNWTWTPVGWVMVPLNRCWPVQPRLPVWDGPNWVYCRASRRCLQRGKVMGVLHPGPVGMHNLVCPLLFLCAHVPEWDGPRRWSLNCLEVDTGPHMT